MKKNSTFEFDFEKIIKGAITETISEMSSDSETGLMNAIDFCKDMLKINTENDRPYFDLILKMWYINTPGNESLKITEDDIKLIESIDNYGVGNPWLKTKALKIMNGEITKPFKYLIACLGRRSGKASAVDTPVLTPDGWKKMGDIKVNDLVYSVDGLPTRVTGVFPQGKIDIYKVTFGDGSSTECSKDHLWFTYEKKDRKNKKRSKDDSKWNGSVKSTEEIMNSLSYKRKDGKLERNHQIPLTEPVFFKEKELPIDPYMLGCLLGDGCLSKKISISSADNEIIEKLSKLLPEDLEFVYRSKYDYDIVKKSRGKNRPNNFINLIDKLNLRYTKSYNKFIPDQYKFNSVENRLSILNGLLDTDGTVDHRQGKLSFCTTSEKLAKDVQFLVQSLGGISTINICEKKYTYNNIKKSGRKTFVLQIKLPSNISPFCLKRKSDIYSKFINNMHEPKRFIDSVEFIGQKEAQCISVENESHLYLVNDFIVTHNTYLSSAIQAYDIYKLLYMNVCLKCKQMYNVKPGTPCPKCGTITSRHPQAYFGQRGTEPMRIIMAATSSEQAIDPGMKFLNERVNQCPLFDDKVELEAERAYFRTEKDIETNKEFSSSASKKFTKGSIMARAVASNSGSLHGMAAVLISFDEFALFSNDKTADGTFTDQKMIEALVPATSQFEVKHPEFGRVIMLSAPQFRQGEFYKYYKNAQDLTERGDNYLMFQMPTWEWCNSYTKEFFMNQHNESEDNQTLSFDKVYGAQFIDESENTYLPKEATEMCFIDPDIKKSPSPRGFNFNHYMHIDCAYNTCNYAYVIVHQEGRFCEKTGKIETVFVQDDSKFWAPSKSKPDMFVDEGGSIVSVQDIWEEIVKAGRSYRIYSLSYDNMQTPESKAFFRRKGLPLRVLSFAGKNKASYYGLLKNSILEGKLVCCSDDHRLRNELLNLKVKFTERGPKIMPNPSGIVKTMDMSDCLAGACFVSTARTTRKITQGAFVRGLGNNNAGNSIFSREVNNIKKYGD
jgi:hypothetical protein